MANTDESRAAAKTALDAYCAQPGAGTEDDDGANIADLIADLAHLADRLQKDADHGGGPYDLPDGDDVLTTARSNFEAEREDRFANL